MRDGTRWWHRLRQWLLPGRAAPGARRARATWRCSEQRFHHAFRHAPIAMALLADDGRLLQANREFRRLIGLGEGDLGAPLFSHFVGDADAPQLEIELERVAHGAATSYANPLRCRRLDGSEVWLAVSCSVFTEPPDPANCLIVHVHDISDRQQTEARLQHIAFHDSLTGLPNRHRFHELLAQAIAQAGADPGAAFAVMFLDFDRFKHINDSLGHSAGDAFLVHIARRLQSSLRPGDIVARLGGDEFAILLQGPGSGEDALGLAGRLQQALREPVAVAGVQVSTSASIGITCSDFHYTEPGEVLRDADIAMYRAKAAGKARHALFDLPMRTALSQRLAVESELREALATQALALEYQPVFSLVTGHVIGFEALARWDHPRLGRITPAEFIPVAEESGLVVALTDFVLARACRQMREWQLRSPQYADLMLHVNISGNDLAHPALVPRVMQAVLAAGLRPQHLTLEFTENILTGRIDGALPLLEELRRVGVRLSVDDFGTGSSSLACLSSLPIDSLKIDRSFVRALAQGQNGAIVSAIVFLAHALGKSVVAEGIETASQFGALCSAGCEAGQGFHLAPALAAEQADALLDSTRAQAWVLGTAAAQPGQLCH